MFVVNDKAYVFSIFSFFNLLLSVYCRAVEKIMFYGVYIFDVMYAMFQESAIIKCPMLYYVLVIIMFKLRYTYWNLKAQTID